MKAASLGLLLLVSLFCIHSAQADSYVFEIPSSGYTQITGATGRVTIKSIAALDGTVLIRKGAGGTDPKFIIQGDNSNFVQFNPMTVEDVQQWYFWNPTGSAASLIYSDDGEIQDAMEETTFNLQSIYTLIVICTILTFFFNWLIRVTP